MNKEFIPYEQALELKELGFDEPCFGWFQSSRLKKEYNALKDGGNQSYMRKEDCNAPTFSQAFRWFRERYNLHCWVYTSNSKEFWYSILKDGRMMVRDYKPFNTYEEADLACLDRLIEIVKP
jgi:hypothetical protein